jgi:hypothetical protein
MQSRINVSKVAFGVISLYRASATVSDGMIRTTGCNSLRTRSKVHEEVSVVGALVRLSRSEIRATGGTVGSGDAPRTRRRVLAS